MNYSTRRPFANFINAGQRGDALVRAAACSLLSTADGVRETAAKIATREWGRESDPAILLRAATSPTATTNAGGDQLVVSAVHDFLSNLGPQSAGSVLLSRGLQLQFGGFGSIAIPNIVLATGSSSFVAEGSPIPARQLSLDGVSLTPDKLACITTFTHETLVGSLPNIVGVVGRVLSESVALDLDSALFDTTQGTSTRPGGLRAGIAGLTASASTGDEAMKIDLSVLAAAVSSVAGNGGIVFIAAPRQAAAIKIRQPAFGYEVLSSSSLTAGTVIAVAVNALVSAINSQPVIESSIVSTIHENTTPLPIVDGSSTPAAGTRSLWQSDTVGLRLVLEVSWGLRSASALAWTSSVVW
jgi:hypothetical protein